MTDAVTEHRTNELRWRGGKLEQKWSIMNLAQDARWTVKEEWREVPAHE